VSAPLALRVGVLALQGDFALHRRSLARLGLSAAEIRLPGQLESLDALVLPGGESSTMLKLMEGTGMEDALRAFAARGGACFGTCAGLILLAAEVADPPQRSLGLLDVAVRRNGYGRQVDSFETDLEWTEDAHPVRGVFIRAPRIVRVGAAVEVLAARGGEPVLVRQGRILGAVFHPEATDDVRLHRYFVETAAATREAEPAGGAR
jgi:5'-phosphate synthase pdxT subunit